MFVPVTKPLDLKATLKSGQSFRWREDGDWFLGLVFGNAVKIRQLNDGIEFESAPDDESKISSILKDYLSLEMDLDNVYRSIGIDDQISEAIEKYHGMRILRQDPWETLMCFICSSASNIPRITKNVESLCTTFGYPVELSGRVLYTYPKPSDLAGASEKELQQLGLGYRARYLISTARAVEEGKIDLIALRKYSYEKTLEALVTLDGVGDKVGNCVALFSLDKLQAFPVDTWIMKVLRERYLKGKNKGLSQKKMRIWAGNYFGPYAGYANHYLFHDRRLSNKVQ